MSAIAFAEAMLKTDLEPFTLDVDGETVITIKGAYAALLSGFANKKYPEIPDTDREHAVTAFTCAGVSEKDPAEAIEYLVKSNIDLPISFVAGLMETWEFIDEYMLLHPPDLVHFIETPDGKEFRT